MDDPRSFALDLLEKLSVELAKFPGVASKNDHYLALAYAGTFAENMSAGRGFIAIAVVALGRWNPLLVLPAAIFFGAAAALQFLLQALGLDLPYQFFLALPYLVTLAALAGRVGRARAPASLALSWPRTT